jgi:hypothetical protein
MANAGTLLTDLDTKAPIAGDGDLVKMIYQDMHTSQSGDGMRPGAQMPGPMPPPQSTAQYQMDSVPATAHVIGGQHPTSADFAQMLQSSQPGFSSDQNRNWSSMNTGNTQNSQAQLAAQIATMQANQGKQWYSSFAEELKTPILIAILVFCVNLPFLSVLVAHYAPWMLKSSGDMNVYGQISKALLVGLLFWGANRLLLPLLATKS